VRYLKPIPNCLTEKQELAVGAVIFYMNIKNDESGDFNKWLARTCIKLQTFFEVENE